MAPKRQVDGEEPALPGAEPAPKAARLEAPPAASAKVPVPPALSAKAAATPKVAFTSAMPKGVTPPVMPLVAPPPGITPPPAVPQPPKAAAAAPPQPTIEESEKDDAAGVKRNKLAARVAFEPHDTTLNVVPANGGAVLKTLSDGGLSFLMAGARASVAVKQGRYFYEVRVLEALVPLDSQRNRTLGKQVARVGFSTAGSSLFLGETEDGVCFDSEGQFVHNQKRTTASQRFSKHQVVGVLLNLDKKSANANTVSLFIDGVRVSEPQKLPDGLLDKPLCPHVSWKNMTLQAHFGPEPQAPLSFKSTMWQAAAQADVVVTPAPKKGKDGKFEVVFPVGVPDEGTFQQLDQFLEDNPHFVELSDRSLLDWIAKSGLPKPKPHPQRQRSNDRPEMQFGLPGLDDFHLRRVVSAVAPLVPRNYVVMEVKSNLVQAERSGLLKRFSRAQYRRIARVSVGQPPDSFKERVFKGRLKAKQQRLDAEYKVRLAEKEKKRQAELKKQELAKKREEAKKKAEEEARKKAEEASKSEAGDAEGEKNEDAEMKDSEKKDEAKTEEDVKDEKEETAVKEEEEEPPVAELSDDEKQQVFMATELPDVASTPFSVFFDKFCLPAKEEGFDQIQWEWSDEAGSENYLTKWIAERKLTTRIEDLQPSSWFYDRREDWQKLVQEWQVKQKAFKQELAARQAAKKAAKNEAGAEGEEANEDDGEAEDEAKAEEGKAEEAEAEVRPSEAIKDVFGVEDVCDVGGGEPLFHGFAFEDWSLMGLRFELHLLVRAFRHDVEDLQRPGISEEHLPFYYQKYYRKPLNVKFFGKESITDLISLVKDTVEFNDNILATKLEDPGGFDHQLFVKLTEEERRLRHARIEAGDDGAKLRFNVMASAMDSGPKAGQRGQQPRYDNKGAFDKGGAWGGKAWGKGFKGNFKGGFKGKWPGDAAAPGLAMTM